LLAYSPLAGAGHPELETQAGDYKVHLGVVPADRIAKYPDLVPHDHPIKAGKDLYHVLVAMYDKSGQRVDDVTVKATLEALGLNAIRKGLHRVEMDGAITYCNFFHLQPGDYYTIDLDIRRTAWQAPLHVKLDYGQPPY
jgi:hypothetical protein